MGILTKNMVERMEQAEFLEDIFEIIDEGIKAGLFTKDDIEKDLEAVLWLAYVYINLDKYPYYLAAEKVMRKVKSEGEKNPIWCYRYACAQLFLGKSEEALKYSKMATEVDPTYPWGWLMLAKMYYKFQDKEKAFEAIEKGLELVPNDYEFLTLKNEIENNVSFSRVVDHVIDEEYDKLHIAEEDKMERIEREKEEYNRRYKSIKKHKC